MIDMLIIMGITFLPIYGLIFLGIRRERESNSRLLRDATKALLIVRRSRGRN